MQFKSDGPDFPPKLLEAIMAGEVVVLCGAGISAPAGLPGFGELTDLIFEKLGEEKLPAEIFAYNAKRYEECIGALATRIANPTEIIDAIDVIFAEKFSGDLSRHDALLRLSKDSDNRVSLVTTNFDTLFERALKESNVSPQGLSFSGQDMPSPGASDFSGIIHIHGRLACQISGFSRTPLVLTSSDFGDAYLRSGWASRFLFDLVRCRTLLLIGYSAGDVIVRYILNVLHADRERFPEVRDVYALVAASADDQVALAPWDAISVDAIPFDPKEDYKALWNSIEDLLAYVESADSWRQDILQKQLARPFSEVELFEVEQCVHALQADAGLWDIVAPAVKDPKWVERLTSDPTWPPHKTRSWLLAFWASLNWEDISVFEMVTTRSAGIGREFATDLEWRLNREMPKSVIWAKAWRLLAEIRRANNANRLERMHYVQSLSRTPLLAWDIYRYIHSISPFLTVTLLSDYGRQHVTEEGGISRLGNIAKFDLETDADDKPQELLKNISTSREQIIQALSIAEAALEKALREAKDAECFDTGRWSVPSIEEHEQNDHHHGYLPLVRLLADAFNMLAALDVDVARSAALRWFSSQFVLLKRLALNAFRNGIFDANECSAKLLALASEDLSSLKRELMLFLKERSSEINNDLRVILVNKIFNDTRELYPENNKDFDEDFEKGWRVRARDRIAWLLLKSMSDGGADEALPYVEELANRYDYFNREIEDHDYFETYSSGVRDVAGDTAQLVEATPEQRLDLIATYQSAPDFRSDANWSTFCRQDPVGALAALKMGGEKPELKKAWADLMWAFTRPETNTDQVSTEKTAQIAQEAFQYLEGLSDDFVYDIVYAMVWAFGYIQSKSKEYASYWWDRLWHLAAKDEEQTEIEDLLTRAINSSGGRLAEILLLRIEKERSQGNLDEDLRRLGLALSSRTNAGSMARAIGTRAINFLQSVDAAQVSDLLPFLKEDSSTGRGLRQILLSWAPNLSRDVSRQVGDILLQGALEITSKGSEAYNAVAKLIAPILGKIEDGGSDFGLDGNAVRNVLRQSNILRAEAAELFARWMQADSREKERAVSWEKLYKPAFVSLWPKDKRYRSSETSLSLARFAVGCEDAFPDSLKTLRHYIMPSTAQWTEAIFAEDDNFDVCVQFPEEAITLMYLLYGVAEDRSIYRLNEPIERILKRDAKFGRDRRIQTLKRKSMKV